MEDIYVYNTAARAKELFVPLVPGELSLYCCGPTVYNYAHIGNLRTYIFEDVLRRTFELAGYKVNHVMNITDIGHLSGTDEEGDDKMVASAKRAHKSVEQIAEYYSQSFFRDCDALHILRPHIICRATEHIQEMIDLIQRLERAGYTYEAGGNIYFATGEFSDYGKMARLQVEKQMGGLRVDIDKEKRNPNDFVLWFTNSKFKNHALMWPSPWGPGYPGWHIECSAMSCKYLGEQFDMHCGGVDHIALHHTNEVAQVESVTKRPWVRYWVHGEFLLLNKDKMSKSTDRFLTLQNLTGGTQEAADSGADTDNSSDINPLDFRYFCLNGHYQSQLSFSDESLRAASSARSKLMARLHRMRRMAQKDKIDAEGKSGTSGNNAASAKLTEYIKNGRRALFDNLNTPQLLAIVWEVLRSEVISPAEKIEFVEYFDSVLGILDPADTDGAGADPTASIDDEMRQRIESLIQDRATARAEKDWQRADAIRQQLEQEGIVLIDNAAGTEWDVRKK